MVREILRPGPMLSLTLNPGGLHDGNVVNDFLPPVSGGRRGIRQRNWRPDRLCSGV
jgi:hypothetical protein